MSGPEPIGQDEMGRSHVVAEGQEDGREVTSFDLLRRVILGLIQAIGDGAELVSTSLAEELIRFRLEVEHRLVVVLLMSSGILLLSLGVIFFANELIGSWPATLLLVGGAHVAVALWLSSRWKRTKE